MFCYENPKYFSLNQRVAGSSPASPTTLRCYAASGGRPPNSKTAKGAPRSSQERRGAASRELRLARLRTDALRRFRDQVAREYAQGSQAAAQDRRTGQAVRMINGSGQKACVGWAHASPFNPPCYRWRRGAGRVPDRAPDTARSKVSALCSVRNLEGHKAAVGRHLRSRSGWYP